MRHTLTYKRDEMKWNLLFGSRERTWQSQSQRSGQRTLSLQLRPCAHAACRLLPAAGGARRRRGRGCGECVCVLGGCWLRVEKLNIWITYYRASELRVRRIQLISPPLPSPAFPCLANPVKGQLFVYALSFKLSSNVDNNPVGPKTVPAPVLYALVITNSCS